MARSVLLHLGVPKSGTSFLQGMVWANRDVLAAQGLLYPGHKRGLHWRASSALRGTDGVPIRAWHRLRDEIRGWEGRALVSHESLGAASAQQAAAAIAELAPAEVQLLVTTRDFGTLLPSVWQQRLKRGVTVPLADFRIPEDDGTMWSWRGLDPADVLDRWAVEVPPERVHIIVTRPTTRDPAELWRRFAVVCGVDPASCPVEPTDSNPSLSAPAAELLRRLLAELGPGYATPEVNRDWVKRRLVGRVLTTLDGDRLRVPPERLPELSVRAERCIERLQAPGYHVVGDLADLRPTSQPFDDTGHTRAPTETELLAGAVVALAETVRAWRAEQTTRGDSRTHPPDEG